MLRRLAGHRGGLIFAGEGNGSFNAYDARTGQTLWQFQTGAGVNAPPVTYEVDGEQFVAVAAGGNAHVNFARGDTLWVFSLKGTQDPVAPPPLPKAVADPGAVAVNTPRIYDFNFSPAWILIPPGTTVTWTHHGSSSHTTTADRGEWDSGSLQPGQSYSVRFDTPGTYDYLSAPHPFMRGKVIVDVRAPKPVEAALPSHGIAAPALPAPGNLGHPLTPGEAALRQPIVAAGVALLVLVVVVAAVLRRRRRI
ncbi:MAG TPA: plastocyanin/azurin family copper-binding protein [Herpetosiphonaceae bacterium]|nr:plastocyanin/azurin family copper-binding protein [Herpetosiphonaceae bacterium]